MKSYLLPADGYPRKQAVMAHDLGSVQLTVETRKEFVPADVSGPAMAVVLGNEIAGGRGRSLCHSAFQ